MLDTVAGIQMLSPAASVVPSLSVAELTTIFEGENKTYQDYKNKKNLIGLGAKVMTYLGLERRLFR